MWGDHAECVESRQRHVTGFKYFISFKYNINVNDGTRHLSEVHDCYCYIDHVDQINMLCKP